MKHFDSIRIEIPSKVNTKQYTIELFISPVLAGENLVSSIIFWEYLGFIRAIVALK